MTTFLNSLGQTRLYPLTDRVISGLPHNEQVHRLSQRGVTLVQLREKLLPAREFYQEAAAALSVARERGIKIIINDRVDIAMALKADGVHLGQDDIPAPAARQMLGPHAIIGISTHSLDQARCAATMPVDYVAIGPIFSTTTKESSNVPLGLDGLHAVREALPNIPLVAIGGITDDNRQQILDSGADGLAVISAMWPPLA